MCLGDLPPAMCYVPYQRWKKTYSAEQALCAGTLFPELNLPFKGGMQR
ncbi:MAG: spore coat associated protein CotJA [Firmicutes bacterium]|nr:spore coat associated protein CotJA [Bacillota bacterium]